MKKGAKSSCVVYKCELGGVRVRPSGRGDERMWLRERHREAKVIHCNRPSFSK